MKSFIVFTMAVFPFVHCALDPTTICMPEKFTVEVYDTKRAVTGTVTVDYQKNIAVSIYEDGVRHVVDMHTNTLYNIQPDSKCTRFSYPPEANKPHARCLPDNAVNPGSNIALGIANDRLILQYWSVDFGNDVSALYAYTTGIPAIPVLRQALKNGTDDGMFVYANPRTEINTTLLAIPLVCPEAVIVSN